MKNVTKLLQKKLVKSLDLLIGKFNQPFSEPKVHHAPPIAPPLGKRPTTTCHMVEDEVWQEECTTKFNNSCRMEQKPVCHTISAKECSPEPKER